MLNKFKRAKKPIERIDPYELLAQSSIWRKDEWQRLKMTTSCRDTDYIPKVKDAGKIKTNANRKVQVMHNGLLVKLGGYHGEWMAKIIESLKGHHEPQEEKLFYEILQRLDGKPTILELGSFWSYYSLWLLQEFENARAIACEPDPENRKVGQTNALINGLENRITFIDAAAGSADKSKITFTLDSDPTKKIESQIRSVDSLIAEHGVKHLDILHMDVQGVELDTLQGALESIRKNKVRFIFVSTHHYFFSGDAMTHQKCKQLIEENSGHIIAAHSVLESFSGDGLIVASFDRRDKDWTVPVSINSSDDSLFRPYEEDIRILADYLREQT